MSVVIDLTEEFLATGNATGTLVDLVLEENSSINDKEMANMNLAVSSPSKRSYIAAFAADLYNCIEFIIFGRPKPLERPRIGKCGRFYNPSEKLVKEFAHAASQHLPQTLIMGPVKVEIHFVFTRPLSHFNSHGQLLENTPRWMTIKPDIDNLIKLVLDSLNKRGYADDSQVVELSCKKYYGNVDKTFVKLTAL